MTSLESLLNLAIEIQQIPAPTFSEGRRAEFVEARYRAEGLEDVTRDHLGNVHARLPGSGRGRPLVLAAHLDTVFPSDTDLAVRWTQDRIYGPGIGDNALGVAGLFGLVWELRGRGLTLPGDLFLVATVGEEGLGNSHGMQGVVDLYSDRPLAYLALEGMGLGQIYHRGVMARRFKITYRTKGGHSWVDYGAPSAVHELARLVSRLTELRLSESPRTTWNAGLIEGGASVNTIASEASVQVDLRSDDEAALAALADDVTWAARSIPRDGVDVSVELIGERFKGSIPEDHPLVRLAFDSLSAVEVEPRLSAGSTDASIPLHHGLPAVCIGLTTGSGSHSVDEYISIPPLAQGMEQLVRIASGAEHALNPRSGSASPPDKIPP